MKIELLYFSGCPTFKNAEDVLAQAMKELGYDFDYEVYDIASDKGQELVREYKITGVPVTIIDGKAVFSGVPSREEAITTIF